MIIQERWPALVKSGSNIVLPASTVSIAYLKVGGRALSLTSQLSVAIPALTANTRYQVFCVAPLGVPALVISTNENSVGPVGYASWKLVGSFYADGLASVGFGSFVKSLVGIPDTEWMGYLPTLTGISAATTNNGKWRRYGDSIYASTFLTVSSSAGTTISVSAPANLLADYSKLQRSDYPRVGAGHALNSASGAEYVGSAILNNTSTSQIAFVGPNVAGVWAGAIPFASWAVNNTLAANVLIPITGFSNTPIQDL